MLFYDDTIDYPNGVRIRCRINRYNNRPRLVFVHGLSSTIEMYEYMFAYCDSHGIALNLIELRGHGNSGGSVQSRYYFDECVTDLKRFLFGHLHNQPVYLAGEGPGACLFPDILHDPRFNIRGAAVVSPMISLPLSSIERLFVVLASRLFPEWPLSLHNAAVNTLCDDPESIELFSDSSGCNYSPVFMRSLLKEGKRFCRKMSALENFPLLIFGGGEDPLIRKDKRAQCLSVLCGKNSAAECVQIKNGRHHLLLGRQRVDVLTKIMRWMKSTERAHHNGDTTREAAN